MLLEEFGDDTMREAIGRAVRGGTLSVTGVTRALSTLGARRRDGDRRRAGAAQPRARDARQLTLSVRRAEPKGGDS